MLVLPSQTRGVLERHGLTRAEAERSAWAIEPGGRAYAGAAAINRALAELGGGWRVVSAAYAIPPLAWMQERVYRQVARNRHALARLWSATPACDEPDAACD